jgi:hypothetical protein
VDQDQDEFYFLSNSAYLYKIKGRWRDQRGGSGWL